MPLYNKLSPGFLHEESTMRTQCLGELEPLIGNLNQLDQAGGQKVSYRVRAAGPEHYQAPLTLEAPSAHTLRTKKEFCVNSSDD